MLNFKLPLAIVALTVLGVATIGCKSERSKKIDDLTSGNITKMAMIYNCYTSGNSFKGPTDEDQLREWTLNETDKARMMKFNIDVDKFDDYMVSERTGEKFEIRWGVNSMPMGPPRPVVFETTAVDGVRQVGMAGGRTLDVDTDEEFDELMKGIYVPDDFEKYPNRRKKKRKKKK